MAKFVSTTRSQKHSNRQLQREIHLLLNSRNGSVDNNQGFWDNIDDVEPIISAHIDFID